MKKYLLIIVIACLFVLQIQTLAQPINTEENNYLKITRNQKQLKSKLSYNYDGYEFEIKNIGNEDITIKTISIWYNANAKVAYLSIKKDNKTAAKETFAKGKKLALRTFGLSLIPYGIAAPFSAIKNDIVNCNAEKEATNFDKKISDNHTLQKGETISIKTMAMKKYTPIFKLTFINPITDENMDMFLK